MNCHYHPDREVVGMCVSCGQPICIECKVILNDKLYCNNCVSGGKVRIKTLYEWADFAWWMLPLVLGVIGGFIAYSATKEKNPVIATHFLWVGLIVTIWIALFVATVI